MKRTWLLAFLFLTLWQMLPHEGYNMLYAQDMGDESYGGGYECEDDFGHYYSSVPCDDTPCFEKCTICGGQFICDEFKGHSCEDKNKTHCPYCDQFLTQEEFLYHNCSTQDMGCFICGRPYEDCTCEGPIISPTNPYDTPSNPHVTPDDSIVVIYYPPSNETHTDGSGSNSSSNNSSTNKTPSKSNVTEEKLISYFKSSIYNRTYSSKTCGYCLRGWKTIWQKAGLGEYDGTGHAKDFGPVLIKYGFKVIDSGNGNQRPPNYTPQIGDTRIWDTYPGQKSPSGHIDWWNGTNWVSDYVQQGKWAPGSKYDYYNVSFKIYR